MDIKKLIVVLLVLTVFLVSGCSNPIIETEDDISLWVEVGPIDNDTYEAFGSIKRLYPGEQSDEFNDALITVNGLSLTLSAFDGNFVYNGDKLKLQTGDTVTIVVSHSSFGKVEDSLTVPPSVSNLAADNINQYVSETVNSITLNWDKVDSTGYLAWIYRYYDSDMSWTSGKGIYVNSNSHIFTNSDLYDDEFGKADAVKFAISALNNSKYETTFGVVDFEVAAPSSPSIPNF